MDIGESADILFPVTVELSKFQKQYGNEKAELIKKI